MSILLLTVLVPLVGLVAYLLLQALVRSVRIVLACLVAAFLAVFTFLLQSRETIAHQEKSPHTFDSPEASDQRPATALDPTLDPGHVAYVAFQSISKEDHDFLDKILEKEYQDGQAHGKPVPTRVQSIRKVGIVRSGDELVLRAELVINTAEGKRSVAVNHHETFKRPELARSRQ
jgi:hypothetical protein